MSVTSLQSRSRQEDPEQLRLKQKAKEVSVCYDKWLHSLGGIMVSFSVKLNRCVTACVPDAAAGAGSDQTERSQPNGTGSNRPEEKTENGLSC